MSVHKRSYKAYSGPLTAEWSRFLVLQRYARESMFRSRIQTSLFVLCFFYPLLCLAFVYLANNASFLTRFDIRAAGILRIDAVFFLTLTSVQNVLAFILTIFSGPGLISPDLANGALPLYFCRPFSRTEYILGKASCLAILLSWVTWVPELVLFAVQSSLAGFGWFKANLWMAGSIVLVSWIWIAVLCLLSLALSAWVRWRLVAGALLLGVLFVGAGFGQAVNHILGTDYGYVFDITNLIATISCRLFGVATTVPISQTEAWSALLSICAACLLLLRRKVQAYEVVK